MRFLIRTNGLLFRDRDSFFLFRNYFHNFAGNLNALVAFFEGDPAGELSSAALAAEIGGKALVVQSPLLYPAHGASASVTSEFELRLIDLGVVDIGYKVVLKGHALIKILAVSLEDAVLKRRAAGNRL